MLSQLYIENIAVIEKASIEFEPGFTVLTGETGAGKSIIIDAINAVLGERISRDMVRSGARQALVSAVFRSVNRRALEKLEEFGFPLDEEGAVILQRTVSQEGKSACRLNGRPATAAMLREIGVFLVNILGQHESYHLLSPDLHVEYLDQTGNLQPLLAEYRRAYGKMRALRERLDALQQDDAQKARQIDLLQYQIQELEDAGLRPGEREELLAQRTVFQNSEKIARAVSAAYEALDGAGEEAGAVSASSAAAGSLEEAGRYLPAAAQVAERVRAAAYELEDCCAELRGFLSQVEVDPAELEQMEERLDVLYRLSRKYGETEEEMLAFLGRCRAELERITLSEEEAQRLEQAWRAARREAEALAQRLSQARAKTAAAFTRRVQEELAFLDMPGAVFQIEQKPCALGPLGCDKVQFLISANPGEPARPLSKIASGGELSRMMLAVKTVLSGQDEIDTLIFDEIDTGISGSAAQKVGKKLQQVAGNRQVLCVTHLPQIAAMAGAHFLIEKRAVAGRTFTEVHPLDFEGRKRELSRMIGGGEVTPLMLQNAEEMLRKSAPQA